MPASKVLDLGEPEKLRTEQSFVHCLQKLDHLQVLFSEGFHHRGTFGTLAALQVPRCR
jgi:hypothetical protein